MKTSYKILIAYEIIIMILLLINSFFINFLSNYIMAAFLLILIIIFAIVFGFERDRNYYTGSVILEMIISLLVFFIVFYLLGLAMGFTKTSNYYSIYGFKEFIIPTTLYIILKEILRFGILKKAEKSKILIITTYITFVLLDLTNGLYFGTFDNSYQIFVFIATILLPIITKNALATYVSYKCSFVPVLIYLLIIELYQYLIPIIPNPNEYMYSLIFLIVPIVIIFRLSKVFQLEEDEFEEREIDKSNPILLAFSFLIVLCLGYFTSGYFKYYAIAIASGSMTPAIHKGDVVIIEKLKKEEFSDIEKGNVLAFEYNGVIVVHRIIDIKKDKEGYYFYTQGDANTERDNFAVTEDMVVGTVNIAIPLIGMPTVWLNEL